jgi:predicted DCC family thiol-disulfide oxidoreductase YuxK
MGGPNRAPVSWPDDGIILYDGVCVLCSGWMRYVLKRDRDRLFRFTPIQSDYGRALALALHINPDDPDTNAVIWRGEAYRRSDAALRAVSLLPGLGWVTGLHIVPHRLRDAVYRLIARSRYHVWGRNAACDLGDASWQNRVITGSRPS